MKDPMFFSLDGLDVNDDEALEAFANHVWEQFTKAHPRNPEPPQSPLYKGDVRT